MQLTLRYSPVRVKALKQKFYFVWILRMPCISMSIAKSIQV